MNGKGKRIVSAIAVMILLAGSALFSQTFIEVENPGILKSNVHTTSPSTGVILAEGGFDFNDGTVQSWTVDGPRDEIGGGPFASHFSHLWADAVSYASAGLVDPIGDNIGSYKICNTSGHGITNPGATYWFMYWISPDLSTSTHWQEAEGFSIALLNYMAKTGAAPGDYLDLSINLHVTVYDLDEARNRYFRLGDYQEITTWLEDENWISKTFNWTSIYSSVPRRIIRDIYVSVRGRMVDNFEGGIYLDEVQPIASGGSPTISLNTSTLNYDMNSDSLFFTIANSGSGTLTWSVAENPDVPWITSVTPESGVGEGSIKVVVDRSQLTTASGTATIAVTSDGGDENVTCYIEQDLKSDYRHPEMETLILAADGLAGDQFGYGLDIDGEYAIIGASENDNINGTNAGAAYIYKYDGTEWLLQQKIIAGDGVEDDLFGYSVALSDEYAVVGAPWVNAGSDKAGAAYIFKRQGTIWNQQAKLVADDAGEDNRLGINVAIDGSYAFAGAFFDDDHGPRTGSAYVFKRDGETWAEQQKLLASDAAENDWFGVAISVDGEYAAIGARTDDNENGINAGAVYVFNRDGETWTEQQKLIAGDGGYDDRFHKCVLNGSQLVIGAYSDDVFGINSGSVYLFERSGTTWTEQIKFIAPGGAPRDEFGRNLDFDGHRIVVGAFYDDNNGINSGSVYTYVHDGSSWNCEMKIIASDGAGNDWFGRPVAIDSEHLLVAAKLNDDMGINSGSVYAYYLSETAVESNALDIPETFKLHQNYPNPFNPSTKLSYTLPERSTVTLKIYNVAGRLVATLEDGVKPSGQHQVRWFARDAEGAQIASGIYFCRLTVGDEVRIQKLVFTE
ncbi:T9SS type A sorting domain-containing protein [bacterium]|nr:T9SS type A sorting domain-containing protein [bacterium]